MVKPSCIVKCGSYDKEEVYRAVDRAFYLLGGIDKYINKGQTVLIKANLMRKSAPELCCVTHPVLVEAIAKRVTERGADAIIFDSPGGAFNSAFLKGVYLTTGMEEAAKNSGAELNGDFSFTMTELGGKVLKKIDIADAVLKADLIINVAKLKTHAHATYTGAVKNMFGCVPGFEKAEMHFNYADINDFANAIIDIAAHVNPTISFIDGIMAMEGNGPGSGEPRFLGALIASEDMFSADLAALHIVNIPPNEVPVMREAQNRGLTDLKLNAIGDDIEELAVDDFLRSDFVDNNVLRGRVPSFLEVPLSNWLALKPVIDKNKCVGCGICKDICPSKTVKISNKKARIIRKDCIKCFCCQEFCPKKAISGKRNRVVSVVMKVTEE